MSGNGAWCRRSLVAWPTTLHGKMVDGMRISELQVTYFGEQSMIHTLSSTTLLIQRVSSRGLLIFDYISSRYSELGGHQAGSITNDEMKKSTELASLHSHFYADSHQHSEYRGEVIHLR